METIKTAIFQPWNKYTAKKTGFKTKAVARNSGQGAAARPDFEGVQEREGNRPVKGS
jgi:hypothetical protein